MPLPNQKQEVDPKPFLVEQYELHVSTYKVIAENAAKAISQVLCDKGELVENSTEFVEVCEEFGMPVEGNEELAEELRAMLVIGNQKMISTIRSVRPSD